MAIFHCYVANYQRVNPIKSHQIPWNHHFPMVFLWFSYDQTTGTGAESSVPRIFLGLGAGAMLAGHSFAVTAAPRPQLAERLGRAGTCLGSFLGNSYMIHVYIYILMYIYILYIYIYIHISYACIHEDLMRGLIGNLVELDGDLMGTLFPVWFSMG